MVAAKAKHGASVRRRPSYFLKRRVNAFTPTGLQLQSQISAPDLGLRRERCGLALGKNTAFGDDIGVIAQRQGKMHILLDQKYGEPGSFELLERGQQLIDDD